MIEISNVHHRFGEREVLKNLNLTLKEKRIAILGSNGSGKSTFARLLNGLVIPTSGTVRVDGADTAKEGKTVRRKVGFVFQDPDNQIVFPIVEEDIAFGMKNLGFDKQAITRKTEEALHRYDLVSHRNHPSHLLSGGQKQLLAISGVLVMEPSYIVFDEPTTLLDLRNKKRVTQAIAELEQTTIVVTHDLDMVRGYDRAIVISDGEVVCDDVPAKAIGRYLEMME
jgi:biotin transport system ATP-binding protein